MKKILLTLLLMSFSYGDDKIFVIQREDSSLAIIKNDILTGQIKNMHDTNHGVVKFYKNDGYAISRDGYVIRFDPIHEKILNEYKTSKSAIGFVVEEDFIAVANYDDKSINILSRDLKPIQKIFTGSRNVGIKKYNDYIVFAQMDNDKITVLKKNKKSQKFTIYKEFSNVGTMPFDAMINDDKYIVGFFEGGYFGVIDMKKLTYKKIEITAKNNQRVLKVPHFGFWSKGADTIFIPSVGDNKVMVYTKDFKFIDNIETIGLPVFTILSPDQKQLAVTFSGEKFPYVQIINAKTMSIIKTYKFDAKILHARWSSDSTKLYLSANDTNKIVVINGSDWSISKEINSVLKPSGIFIYEEIK
ncbi:MAG: nitrite reductase [Arcobacter sp.]|nr:nitrite reductase [Arcobacter sp.]